MLVDGFDVVLIPPESFYPSLERLAREARWAEVYAYMVKPSQEVSQFLRAASRSGALFVLNRFTAVNERAAEVLRGMGARVEFCARYSHAKAYIFGDSAVVGSANLTPAASKWVEAVAFIRDRGFAEELSERLWEVCSGGGFNFEVYGYPSGASYVRAVGGKSVVSELISSIASASDAVYSLMYIATLSRVSKRILAEMARAAARGVEVVVALNGTGREAEYNVAFAEAASKKGIEVYLLARKVHAKAFSIDGELFLGSHNLTAATEAGRFELNIEIASKGMAKAFRKYVRYLVEHYSYTLDPRNPLDQDPRAAPH